MIDELLDGAAWNVHKRAYNAARAVGACVLCAAEHGCQATDQVGMDVNPDRQKVELHPDCAEKIARIPMSALPA